MEFLAELHPIVIHFPIVLFILYFLFELLNIFAELKFSAASHIMLALGIVTGVAAVLSGNLAADVANIQDARILEIIEKHETYASLTLWYFLTILVFRTFYLIKKKLTKQNVIIFAAASLLGVTFVYFTGMYGGQLVYKFGIGTDLIK